MTQDRIKADGSLIIKKYDQNNVLVETHELKNLVVFTGKSYIASRMYNTDSVMSHIAIGLSNSNLNESNTTLSNEIVRVPIASTVVVDNKITYYCTFGQSDGSGSIIEAGIFNSGTANAGTMLSRVTFTAIEKSLLESIVIEWQISIN